MKRVLLVVALCSDARIVVLENQAFFPLAWPNINMHVSLLDEFTLAKSEASVIFFALCAFILFVVKCACLKQEAHHAHCVSGR